MGALRDVARLPDVRRVELGWGLCLVGGMVATVALLVYAFTEGGAALVATYGVARTLPGAVVAVAVSTLADRVRRDRLLRLSMGLASGLLGCAAVLAFVDGPALVVTLLGGGSASLLGSFRPLQAAAMPWLVRTPAELTAANVAATMMENAGTLVGPALAAVVLVVADATTAMAVATGCLALSWLAMAPLRLPDQSVTVGAARPRPIREAIAGVVALGKVAPPAGVLVIAFAQTFVRGAMMVLIVVLALDVLLLEEDAVGWLNAAIGLGGLVGGAVAASAVRVTRLGRSFVTGVALWGLPLVLLGAVPSQLTAYLALTVVGAGNAVMDAAMFTLLPRVLGPRFIGRALGALELVIFAGLGLGSVAAPVLVSAFDARGALLALGVGLFGVAVVYTVSFARVDATSPGPGPELDLLRGLPMFSPLPLVVVERLATVLEPRAYAVGDTVVSEGDTGEDFQVIVEGTAEVTVRGTSRRRLGRGEGFGEIALLRDTPRTATVTAAEPLSTLGLPRVEFLCAVTGNRVSADAASTLAAERTAHDPP